MSRVQSWWVWAVGVVAILAVAWPAAASEPGIRDSGEFFSTQAIEQAGRTLQKIKQEFGKDVVVETFPAIPEDVRGSYDANAKNRFYDSWITREARRQGVNGVLILITKEPAHFQVGVGNKTRQKEFTVADRDALRDTILRDFRQKQFDQGLRNGARNDLPADGPQPGA